MRPWLRGELDGVDLRNELHLVRDAAFAAAHRGESLSLLYGALAARDPIAAAELCAGPRAVAHEAAVDASLEILGALEQTVAPSGLYVRLADLAPEASPRVLNAAIERHVRAPWLVRLSQRLDPEPGGAHLEAVRETENYSPVCDLYAEAGVFDGLYREADRGQLEPMESLVRVGRREWQEAARRALIADVNAPVVPWLAALVGPDVDPLVEPLLTELPESAAKALRVALS